MGSHKYPDSARQVLTYCEDDTGTRFWAIDTYYDRWYEATEWGYRVLHWQELPPVPSMEGE